MIFHKDKADIVNWRRGFAWLPIAVECAGAHVATVWLEHFEWRHIAMMEGREIRLSDGTVGRTYDISDYVA